jgi:hypothetical protein
MLCHCLFYGAYASIQEPERFHFAYEYFVWYVTHPEETTYNKPASILIGIVCSAWLYFFQWFKAKYPPNPVLATVR